MPAHHDDELPTLDATDLSRVTGGATGDMSSMLLPMMMMLRSRAQAAQAPVAAAPDPAAAWKPRILVDGIEQQLASSGNGTFTVST